MRGFSPALVVMLAGVALMLAAGVAWATAPAARGGQAVAPAVIVKTTKAPPLPKQKTGLPSHSALFRGGAAVVPGLPDVTFYRHRI